MLGCWPCVCRTLQCWRYADEYCGCWDATTEDMVEYGLKWFQTTPVFKDLDTSWQEEALENAETILEWAWEWIAPFYNAAKSWNTFASYVAQFWLDVDESWPCDSTVVENDSAFTVYISALGNIHCKYLAIEWWELVNADEIAAYLDWLTTSDVTYTFKDYDWTILKIWTVEKWETPEAPEDPTREAYTFTGWNPEVSNITDDTTYVAQYESVLPTLPNEAYLTSGNSMTLFWETTDADYVGISVEIDPETWDSKVEVAAEWIYADSRLEISGTNVFVALFTSVDTGYIEAIAWNWTTWDTWTIISEFFTVLQNLYENPTAENLATAETLLTGYEADYPTTDFVTWTTP